MKHPSPPLTYFPAYLGLFASLTLAAVCNSFLDIQYGGFGFESMFWAVVFGLTLRIGWRQRGEVSDTGKQGQKMVFIIGVLLSIGVFIPMWGFPRAGLAMLAMLQATQNCVTVSRRQLHMGLLVSAVMVMFAASHFRASWTMLFYLVPYVTAVVFTLVAEQINRRAQDLKTQSLAPAMVGGQGVAIAAATASILLLGGLLYSITPQLTWPYLQWHYGQLTNLGWIGKSGEIELGNQPGGREPGQKHGGGHGSEGQGESGEGQNSSGASGSGADGDGSQGYELLPGNTWPSPADMREAAKQKGMPQWQRSAMSNLADLTEMTTFVMKPIALGLEELWQSIKDWIKEHRADILRAILLMIILSLLGAFWLLVREAKVVTWLLTRFDYLRFGLLGQHAAGKQGARQVYGAMERLFELRDTQRASQSNAREYLAQLRAYHEGVSREAAEITRLFEDFRYGQTSADHGQIARMRALYRQIYQRV